jgi:DUF1680 family protein
MSVVNRTASVVVDTSRSAHAKLRPLAIDAVHLDDAFWAPRIKVNREVTIPTQLDLLEETGRLANFRKGAGKEAGTFEGFYFNDTDVYKWLEAAAWSLATNPDPVLDGQVDAVIQEVASAQEPSGYLDNFYTAGESDKRWTELWRTHELYVAGHLIQAAVAHHRATGKTSLLDIARRFTDHINDVLGPAEEGKQPGTDDHPEVEMALVEMARETGDERYLELAHYFLDVRGYGLVKGDEYHQDHKPFREFDAMVGHAVRILYLNAGAADIYAENGDESLMMALDRLWQNMTTKRMYLTGGLGARHEGESFGVDYELPNTRAYTETCAAIASVMWNWRMLLLTGEAKYADLMEWTLYNAFLPGLALNGTEYFYVNPLADEGTHRRQRWYECSCCPPNITRTLASLTGYVATTSDEEIQLHLYAQGTAEIALPTGRTVTIRQETRYPWDGDIAITVDADGDFVLSLRIPAWCATGASAALNDDPIQDDLTPGTYLRLDLTWQKGDVIRLHFPMSVQLVEPHPNLAENEGRWAITRGPLVYCLEQVDHPGIDLNAVTLPRSVAFAEAERPDFLGGVVMLTATGYEQRTGTDWTDRLYRTVDPAAEVSVDSHPVDLTAIPYYAWANREAGAMRIWVRRE